MHVREDKIPSARLAIVQYATLAVFLLLAYGLWRLQVAGGERYELLAEANRVREVPILAPRGMIVDREGRRIVDNYPSFSALLLRDQARGLEGHIDLIAQGLNMSPESIRDRVRRFGNVPQIVLKDDITPDELAFIEAHRDDLPELETIVAHRRLYPKNGFAAHLIGYVGEVSEDMLDMPQFELYDPGDIVGRSGVEQQYNHILMGKNGSRRVLVNSRGREVGRLGQVPAEPGKELKLTLDLDVQIAAESALEGHNGAIVALDPRTGEVLALVSRPTFDPNHFTVRISPEEWNNLVTDEAKPLLNKAIQAQLAPGSVFKIIMAVAGLEEGIAQNMLVNCGGGKNFYGRFFKCWIGAKHSAHGTVDIKKAIYQSCDSFFYTLGERLTISRIARYATAFGLGQKTGIDLPQEVNGVMPSEEWKVRNFKQKWYAGETISVAIGQGAVTTTPVQLARAIGAIANGGVMHRPHVAYPGQFPPELRNLMHTDTPPVRVPIQPQHWELITDAMVEVVGTSGTAPSARLEGIDFGGKTGTAQVVSNTARAKLTGHRFKDNGWFVGVMPRRNPEIVVAVLVEQGEHGYLAGRMAAQVVKAYAEKQKTRELKVASGRPPQVEVAAVWSQGEAMQGGRFFVPTEKRSRARRVAAELPEVPRATAAGGR